MSYQDKYLKYKNKYKQLKMLLSTQSGGAEQYLYNLKLHYPACQHDKSLKGDYSAHKITYGEMDYEGIDLISKEHEYPNFIDIGSGRGKLCLFMASKHKVKKSIGVELVSERHNDAIDLHLKLTPHVDFVSKVEFINDNIFNVDLKSKLEEGLCLVWFSNLCFNQDVSNAIFDKLTKELPSGSIIVCSKSTTNSKLIKVTEKEIPMSWNKQSSTYFYKIL
jgi:hypothetical protein